MQPFYASHLSYASPPLWKTYKPVYFTNLCKLSLFSDICFLLKTMGKFKNRGKSATSLWQNVKSVIYLDRVCLLKKECVFLFEKLRLLYNMKHIRKRTSLYLCFLQTILSGTANCCFHIFTLYIKISFCPHTFCQKYRMNFKKI